MLQTVQPYTNGTFKQKKVVILGMARQGLALARFFAGAGAHVVISDAAPAEKLQEEMRALHDLPVEFALGGHPMTLLDDCGLLCLSGGVPPQLPLVQEAMRRGIRLSNDSLLTLQFARQMNLGPVIAVTGSSGKTTTTTLIGEMLAASGQTVHVGGNIGLPLVDRLDEIDGEEPVVLELSSFQLELFDSKLAWGTVDGVGPDVAALLNITPNHLDRHPNMRAYAAAKLNLLWAMRPGGLVVVSLDDPVTARLSPDDAPGKHVPLPREWGLEPLLEEARVEILARRLQIVPFSRTHAPGQGAWLSGGTLVCDGRPICRRDDVLLRGEHNISNILAAAAASHCAGAKLPAIGEVARTFRGVAHRLEIVAEHGGVTWINDSIATSPERAMAGLRSFEPQLGQPRQTVILLAGGKDKNLAWDGLAAEIVERVNFLIGFGQSGPMIVNLVQDRARFGHQKAPNCAVVQRLDEAVDLAARIADCDSIVLLSPGGTSFDAYRNFEERGEHFRRLVLRQIEQRTAAECKTSAFNATELRVGG